MKCLKILLLAIFIGVVSGCYNNNNPQPPPNTAPTVSAIIQSVDQDQSTAITLLGNDADGDTLSYAISSAPSNGTVIINGNIATYTPNAGYTGADSFNYTATDSANNRSSPATVSINVVAVVTIDPVANNALVSTDEDEPIILTLTSNISLTEAMYAVVTTPSNGTITITANEVRYTPNPNFNGSDSFSFTVSNSSNTSNPAIATITVIEVNDAPLTQGQRVTTIEDASVTITLTATDIDSTTLTFSVATMPFNGMVSLNGNQAVYTPNSGFLGTDTFIYQVDDGDGATVTATVDIDIVEVIANSDAISVAEDASVALTLTSNISTIDVIYTIVTEPANGSLSLTANVANYTPKSNFNGSDSFSFVVTYADKTSIPATVIITIDEVNDAPVPKDGSASVRENNSVTIVLTATDIDSTTLTYSISTSPTNGMVSIIGNQAVYTPNSNFVGVDSFEFQVDDGQANPVTATVQITIASGNNPPVANAVNAVVFEDVATTIYFNASDIDGDSLTYSIIKNPEKGVAFVVNDTVVYSPDANYFGYDTLTYQVLDTDGIFDTATVAIEVLNVNDTPVLLVKDVTVSFDTATIIVLSLYDQEGDSLTVTLPSNSTNASIELLAGFQFRYTPNSGFTGVDTVPISIDDGSVTIIEQLSISVLDTVIPTVQNANLTLFEDDETTINLVGDDPDGDNNNLRYQLALSPTHGIATIIGNQLRYVPIANYNGADTLSFRVTDEDGAQSGLAQVTIEVISVEDAPTANAIAVTTDENSPINIALQGSDADGDTIAYSLLTTPNNGIATINFNTVNYHPNSNFSGVDTFSFIVTDATGLQSQAITVTITVNAIIVNFFTFPFVAGTEANFLLPNIAANSSGDLSYSITQQPAVGDLRLVNNSVTYLQNGSVDTSFTFEVTDSLGTKYVGLIDLAHFYVNAVGVSSDIIDLNWLDIADFYQVYRSTSNQTNYVLIYSGSTPNFTDTNLQPAQLYYYRVLLCSSHQDCPNVSEALTTVNFATNVNDSANILTLSPNIDNSINVAWQAVDWANGYQLYRSDQSDGGYSLIYSGTALAFVDFSGLAPSSPYYYELRACTSATDEQSCNLVLGYNSIYTSSRILLSIDYTDNNSAAIRWQSGAASHYRLNSSTNGIDYFLVYAGSDNSFEHSQLIDASNYRYKLQLCTYSLAVTCSPLNNVSTFGLNTPPNIVDFSPFGVRTTDLDFNNTHLVSNNTEYQGIFANSTTLWVLDFGEDHIFAYNLATQTRDTSQEFANLNNNGNGEGYALWSNGVTMFVTDKLANKVFAYNHANKQPDSSKNITLTCGGNSPQGLWSDGTTMWVADNNANTFCAYDLVSGAHNSSLTFATVSGNGDVTGLWSDGNYMWASDWYQNKAYAYNFATKQAAPDFDFDFASGNDKPSGITGSASHFFVPQNDGNYIYSYQRVVNTTVAVTSISSTELQISWNSISGAIDYRIYSSTAANGNYSQVYSGNNNTAIDGGLIANTEYFYQIRACATNFTNSCSDYYGINSNLTRPSTTASYNLNFDSNADSTTVSWTITQGSFFRLAASTQDSDYSEIYAGTTNNFHYSGLQNDSEYYYKLQLCSSSDSSTCLPLSTLTPTIAKTEIAIPNTLTIAVISGSEIRVSWEDLIGASYYELYRSTAINGEYQKIYNGSNTTFDDDELSSGIAYFYQLVACNSQDSGCSSRRATTQAGTLPVNSLNYSLTFANSLTEAATVISWSADGTFYYRLSSSIDGNNYSEIYAGYNSTYYYQNQYATTYNYRLQLCGNSDSNSCLALADTNVSSFTTPPYIHDDNSQIGNRLSQFDFLSTDLANNNTDYQGIFTDGSTLWVLDVYEDRLFAYDLATKARQTNLEFADIDAHDNENAYAIWSNGVTMYVTDKTLDRLFAYKHSSKQYNSSNNITLIDGNDSAQAVWSDGTTIWVGDNAADKFFAYDLASGTYNSSLDFEAASGNNDITGLWSDGTIMWASDWNDNKAYAYDLASRQPAPDFDFNFASGNNKPSGITGTENYILVPQNGGNRLYAYQKSMPQTVAISTVNATELALSWNNIDNATHYRLYRSTATNGTYQLIYNGSAVATSDNALAANTEYFYQVKACTLVAIESSCSDYYGFNSSFTRPSATASYTLTFDAATNNITINWSVEQGNYFRLYASTTDSNYSQIYSGFSTSYQYNGLQSGTAYYYQLQLCTNSVSDSCLPLADASTAVQNTVIAVPTTLTTVALNPSQIQVSWKDLTGASYYELYRSTAISEGYTQIYNGASTSVTDSALSSGIAYYYQLVACSNQNLNCSPQGATTQAGTQLTQDQIYSFSFSNSVTEAATTISWTVAGAYYFRLSSSTDGIAYSQIYAGTTPSFYYRNDYATNYHYKLQLCTAANIGSCLALSDASVGSFVTIPNIEADQSNLGVAATQLDFVDTDFASSNTGYEGIFTDGSTLWVLDKGVDHIFAYDLTTKQRSIDQEFANLDSNGNGNGYALWSDAITMYVTDKTANKVFAYSHSNKQPNSSKNITLTAGNNSPQGLWSDSETIWVGDNVSDKFYAYNLATGDYTSNLDFDATADNNDITGLWSDGTTIWVSDWNQDKAFAYDLASRQPAPDFDFNFASGNNKPSGITGTEDYFLVPQNSGNHIYAYHKPQPRKASIIAISTTELTISWGQISGATFYRLYRSSTANGEYSEIYSGNSTATIDNSNLTTSTQYFYQIRACTTVAIETCSDYYGHNSGYTLLNTTASYTLNFTSAANSINVNWTAEQGSYFRLFASSADSDYAQIYAGTGASFNYSGLQSGSNYYFKLQLCITSDSNTCLPLANASSAVQQTTLALPSTLSTAPISSTQIQVSWNDIAGATHYYLFRSLQSNGVYNQVYNGSSTRVLNTTALSSGTSYYYQLIACQTQYLGCTLQGATTQAGTLPPTTSSYSFTFTNSLTEPATTISWTADGAFYYRLNSSTDGNNYHQIYAGFNNSYYFGNAYATSYTYKVQICTNANSNTCLPLVSAHSATFVTTPLIPLSVNYNSANDFNTLYAADIRDTMGLWSDGITMYVADDYDDTIYAFNMATKARDSDKDINLISPNDKARGIWSNGSTMWVADYDSNKVYAYSLATGNYDSSQDFDTLSASGNRNPEGIWSDGTTMWIADFQDDKFYAYDLISKLRVANQEFDVVMEPFGITGHNNTLWTSNSFSDIRFAYHKISKTRDSIQDFKTANDLQGGFLLTDGDTMWYSPYRGNKIYAHDLQYEQLTTTVVSSTQIAISWNAISGATQYRLYRSTETDGVYVQVYSGTTTTVLDTVTSGNQHYYQYRACTMSDINTCSNFVGTNSVITAFTDAATSSFTLNGLANGINVSWSASQGSFFRLFASTQNSGFSEIYAGRPSFYQYDALQSASQYYFKLQLCLTSDVATCLPIPDASTAVYTAPASFDYSVIGNRASALDFDPTHINNSNSGFQGLFTDGITLWVLDLNKHYIFAYDLATKTRNSSSEFDNLETNNNSDGYALWSNGVTMYVTDKTANKVFAYNHSDKQPNPSKDITLTDGNESPQALWSDGETIWVGDNVSDKFYAYNLATGDYTSSLDFDAASGNNAITGLWSDGTTMWASNWNNKAFAYNLVTKQPESDKDFNFVVDPDDSDGPRPSGITGTKDHIYIPQSERERIYAYQKSVTQTVTINVISSNALALSWNSAIGATHYRLYRSTESNGEYLQIYSGANTSYNDNELTAGTQYFYQYSACTTNAINTCSILIGKNSATTSSAKFWQVAVAVGSDALQLQLVRAESPLVLEPPPLLLQQSKIVATNATATIGINAIVTRTTNNCYKLDYQVYYHPQSMLSYRFGYEVYGDWDLLIEQANSEQACGYSNWRVPTVAELQNLRQSAVTFENLQSLLPIQPNPYWSNQKAGQDYGLTVDLQTGAVVSQLLYSYQQLLLVTDNP